MWALIIQSERAIVLFGKLHPVFWKHAIYKCKNCLNLTSRVDFLKHDTSQRGDVPTAMGNVTDMSRIAANGHFSDYCWTFNSLVFPTVCMI